MGGRSRTSRTMRTAIFAPSVIEQARNSDLITVATSLGLQPDSKDKKQFVADGHRVAITGDKFKDFETGESGGGAIDLVMKVHGVDFSQAVSYLGGNDYTVSPFQKLEQSIKKESELPMRSGNNKRARDYLINQRGLSPALVDSQIKSGAIFQDTNGNAVFKYGDTGAELRGTTSEVFKGFRGSKGGGFTIEPDSKIDRVVLVESSIDALSYKQLHPQSNDLIVSIGGSSNAEIMAKSAQLAKDNNAVLVSAFDNDKDGKKAHGYLAAYASASNVSHVQDVPVSKDWNSDLNNKKGGN